MLSLDPFRLALLGVDLLRPADHLARRMGFGNSYSSSSDEFQNKMAAFRLVREIDDILGLPPDLSIPLPDLVVRAYALNAFEALWGVEGVGRWYTDVKWRNSGPPRQLLRDIREEVPGKSLLILHAGMGLTLARKIFDPLRPSQRAEIPARLDRFTQLCIENSVEGYFEAAFEPLGLVTRVFNWWQCGEIDRALEGSPVRYYFWHAIGRALYFMPRQLIPLSDLPWSSIRSVAPNRRAEQNLISGLAWALGMVNMQKPRVLARVLKRYQKEIEEGEGAFEDGIGSCVAMRRLTTPDAAFVESFCEYVPAAEVEPLWETQVRQPARQRLVSLADLISGNQLRVLGQYS